MNEFITNPEDCESIYVEALKRGNKDLVAENQRLKAQLNKEIHYNRIMKRALEKYADEKNWSYNFVQHLAIWGEGREDRKDGPYIARTVLKEIDNKE